MIGPPHEVLCDVRYIAPFNNMVSCIPNPDGSQGHHLTVVFHPAYIMKTYLTLLFCAPLLLYILGAIIMDAEAESPPVSGAVTSQAPATHDRENRYQTADEVLRQPLLVRAGTKGWAGTAMQPTDSTRVGGVLRATK
jgi:hypothetical protein